MGLTSFDEIAREMIAHGRSAETPAMAVRWGTRAGSAHAGGNARNAAQR